MHCQSVDITDRAAVYRAAQQLRDEFGEVDVLVNNAGVLNPTPFLDTDDELISRLVDVNLKSVMWVSGVHDMCWGVHVGHPVRLSSREVF